jgi:hypothetical protein
MDFTLTRNGMRTIPETHLEILEILQKTFGDNFYVTGSLSLLLYGVIDRPIKDLDIILIVGKKKDFYEKVAHNLLSQANDDNGNDDCSDTGQSYECSLKVNGIKVDVFKFDIRTSKDLPLSWIVKVETKHIVIDGFKILEPKPSIDAKLKYIDFFTNEPTLDEVQRTKLKKHLLDVSDYYKWLTTKY